MSKKNKNNKSQSLVSRFKRRALIKCDEVAKTPTEKQVPAPAAALNAKQIESILIDMSLKALYNNGNRVDLKFVDEILKPNKVEITDDTSFETFWDIITNSGLIKAKIGFGNSGIVSITNDGYNLMNQFGSYLAYLKMTQEAKLGKSENVDPVKLVGKATPEPESGEYYEETPPETPDGVH